MVTRDVSRFLVQQRKHFVGARLEQGRVLLDSDFNESVELGREDLRRVLVDAIGPAGSPDRGFSIRLPLATPDPNPDRILPGNPLPPVLFGSRFVHPVAIRAGSLYAGGMRFDLDQPEPFVFQRDYLQLRPTDLPDIGEGDEAARYLYYLRGWEQCVSALEDPEIREVMLEGTDTSVRVRRMRRVEAFKLVNPVANCDEAWKLVRAQLESAENGAFDDKSFELVSDGRLQLTFTDAGEAEDTCAPCDPFGHRYLGAENQTLRILLTSPITFVWTLDDPRLFRVRVLGLDEATPAAVTVEMLDRPSEERDWPFSNRVVEIIPFGALLDGADVPGPVDPHYRKIAAEMGVFTRALETFDPATGSFTVDLGAGNDILAKLKALIHEWPTEHPAAGQLNVTDPDGGRFFYLRLWHQAATRDDIELSTADATELGTTGIVPVFAQAGRAGDHWIAALRPETPKQVVPFELLDAGGAPPAGPRRFFAPLTLLDIADDQTVIVAEDCRPRIRPLINRLCTTYIVGDGVHSFGDFTSIGDAIQALPRSGGVVSVRPGVYREAIQLNQRQNVVLEGCGRSTVIESHAHPETAAIDVGPSCQNVQIRGFLVRSQGPAIRVFGGSGNVALADLELESGDYGGIDGAFRPGVGSSGMPQVAFSQSTGASLSDLRLQLNRQPGLSLSQCPNLLIERVVATSSTEASEIVPGPMLEIRSTRVATVRDVKLRLSGQAGVLIGADTDLSSSSRDIELSDLDIEAGAVMLDNQVFTGIQAPVHFEDAPVPEIRIGDIQLRSSRIRMLYFPSEFAAVTVRGERITIENNEITADVGSASDPGPLAWGGIQVAARSDRVTIKNNRIQGGLGHGITLGSVLWKHGDDPGLHFGAGAGQTVAASDGGFLVSGEVSTTTVDGVTYTATDEGEIADLVIADNRIEGFANSGISVLSVLGITSRDLIELARLRIERNQIRGNVTRPNGGVRRDANTLPFRTAREGTVPPIQVLPVGGIVLANGRNIQISDNVIEANVQPESNVTIPVNGIFVLAGDAIAIENNRISGNGRRAGTGTAPPDNGVRAGIAVMLAGTTTAQNTGQTLNDFLFRSSDALDNRGFALRVANNTVRQPEGRALHAVAAGPVSVDGNFLSSEGNHGSADLHDQRMIGDVVYVQNLGAPWETFHFSPILNATGGSDEYNIEVGTPNLSPILLRGSLSPSPRWYTGLGGGILFVNNQVVYDWIIQRLPTLQSGAALSYFPTALLGVDHTSVIGNQFAVRLKWPDSTRPPPAVPGVTAPLFATVFACGVTLNVELNRMSENIAATFLSLLGNADLMNITTLNQCTHPIASTVTRLNLRKLIVSNNLILIQPLTPPNNNDLASQLKSTLQEFLKLTFRPPH